MQARCTNGLRAMRGGEKAREIKNTKHRGSVVLSRCFDL